MIYITMTDRKKNYFLNLSDSDDEKVVSIIYDDMCTDTDKSTSTPKIDDDPINFYDEKASIIEKIINYINKNNNYPVFIIDGENLIGGPIQHRASKVRRTFSKYNDKNTIKILVVKKSGGIKRFKNYTGIDVPEDYIFISLHADNGTCPDDGFILELASKLNNVYVVTDDEFENREFFNYGNIINGTKLTSNINIDGRYIPDIDIINRSVIRKKSINKKIPEYNRKIYP
jgi:hypothetical protein